MKTTPEFRLLCQAVRWPQGAEDHAALAVLASDAVHWTKVFRGAQEHRLTPLVFSSLRSLGSDRVPAAILEEFHKQSVLDARRCLEQVAALDQLCRAFVKASIPLLVIKGIPLGMQLFGQPALRPARDIDIWVSPGDIARANEVLKEAGYKSPFDTLSPTDQAACWRWVKDKEFVHGATGGVVELHNRLTDNPDLLPWDFDELWAEREELRLHGITIATLPRHRLPLYLCVHGAGHGWNRLRWLVDFAVELGRTPETAQAALVAAQSAKLDAVMLQALMLAHDWMGAAIDEATLRRARTNPAVVRLDFLRDRFSGSPQPGSWAWRRKYSIWLRLYQLFMKRGVRYFTLEIARAWVSPSDRLKFRLPRMFSVVYFLIRPLGWLARR